MGKYDLSKIRKEKVHKIEYVDLDKINSEFLKKYREKMGFTQIRLANILGVTKKTIEKWEQGKNPIKGTSATLLYLLDLKPELVDLLYKESFGVQYELTPNKDSLYNEIFKNIIEKFKNFINDWNDYETFEIESSSRSFNTNYYA